MCEKWHSETYYFVCSLKMSKLIKVSSKLNKYHIYVHVHKQTHTPVPTPAPPLRTRKKVIAKKKMTCFESGRISRSYV